MQKFAGVLTYFYRNPELQVGEYERMFPSKPEAERWVEQFRHRTVMVHVNPARPRDSCVLDSDLEGLDLHLPQSAETAAAVTPSPLIGATYRSLCAFGEIVSTAGIAACAVLLAVRLVTHTNEPPSLFYWLGGAMFAFSAICAIAVWLHLKNDEAGKAFLHTLPQWSPAWLRWSLKVSGLLLGLLPFVHSFSPSSFSFLRPFFKGIAPSLPYLVGCWGFLVTAAFHAAILRSQEEIRASAGGVLEG